MDIDSLKSHILNVKKKILHISFKCNKPVHLGGSFSMTDILTVLYMQNMRYRLGEPFWQGRDRFILSKGHCAAALYAVLSECGIISDEELSHFLEDDAPLTVHPVMNIDFGIESSNGSLGQGISMAAGIAEAAKIKKENFHVYTLIGNGESNEGAVWEAAMLSSHLKLDNLTVILDDNRLQGDGESAGVLNMGNQKSKWESFGFEADVIDGHDIKQISDALNKKNTKDVPKIIIAETVKGRGFSFMENKPEWHHNRLSQSLYEKALKELEEASL